MTKHILLGCLLVILVLVFICAWLTSRVDWEYVVEKLDGGTHTIWLGDIHYAFDPRVVSSTLPAGDFLTPLPSDVPLPTSEPIPGLPVLGEEVFYAIASRLVEDEGGMRLISVSFHSPCAHAGSGFESMGFTYVKRRDNVRDFPYLYIGIYIHLGSLSYDTYEMTAAAPETRWPMVDYNGLEIKASEAVRIAEDHKGRDFRSRVDDVCTIHGVLEDGNTWDVWYKVEGEEGTTLDFDIDATTGEVITVEQ